jgi:hypothetical protein
VTKVEQFFVRYEEGANSFDPDLVSSQFAGEFMGGGPNGVACFENGEELRRWTSARHAFFNRIGFRRAKVLAVAETPLDDRYAMAQVHWQMTFEKEPGSLLDCRFFLTYFLFDDGTGPKVVFWISHDDEERVMREAGLIPTERA